MAAVRRRPLLLASLAAAVLLGGCATRDDRYYYDNGARYSLYDGYGRGYFGYPYRAYPYGYGYPGRYVYDRDRHDGDDRRWADGRFVGTDRDTVCDRRTEVCYRKGDVDALETRDYFGRDAANRVDRIRDRAKDNDIFLPRRNLVCPGGDAGCYRVNRQGNIRNLPVRGRNDDSSQRANRTDDNGPRFGGWSGGGPRLGGGGLGRGGGGGGRNR